MQQIKRHFATRQSENTDFLLCQIQAVFHVYYADRGAYLKFWCKITIFAGKW